MAAGCSNKSGTIKGLYGAMNMRILEMLKGYLIPFLTPPITLLNKQPLSLQNTGYGHRNRLHDRTRRLGEAHLPNRLYIKNVSSR